MVLAVRNTLPRLPWSPRAIRSPVCLRLERTFVVALMQPLVLYSSVRLVSNMRQAHHLLHSGRPLRRRRHGVGPPHGRGAELHHAPDPQDGEVLAWVRVRSLRQCRQLSPDSGPLGRCLFVSPAIVCVQQDLRGGGTTYSYWQTFVHHLRASHLSATQDKLLRELESSAWGHRVFLHSFS